MKTVRALRYSVEPVTREVVHRVVLENDGSKPTLVKMRKPICVMTVRAEFDAYCFEQTVKAGAVFRRIPGIVNVEQQGDQVVVDTGAEFLHASFVVGADGVNSQVRRFCAGAGSIKGGFALEAQVPLQRERVDLTFDFGAIKNGYGWIFPKRDHLNVGLGCYIREGSEKLTRDRLLGYVRRKLGTDSVDHVVGQYLAVSEGNEGCAYGRVLLAGDAGGLIDPLTAEGIYSAVMSGQGVAKAIDCALRAGPQPPMPASAAQPGLDGQKQVDAAAEIAGNIYAEALTPLREMLAFSARAARSFYANPDRGFHALTLPGLRTALLNTYGQGMSSGLLLSILRRRRNA